MALPTTAEVCFISGCIGVLASSQLVNGAGAGITAVVYGPNQVPVLSKAVGAPAGAANPGQSGPGVGVGSTPVPTPVAVPVPAPAAPVPMAVGDRFYLDAGASTASCAFLPMVYSAGAAVQPTNSVNLNGAPPDSTPEGS